MSLIRKETRSSMTEQYNNVLNITIFAETASTIRAIRKIVTLITFSSRQTENPLDVQNAEFSATNQDSAVVQR